MHLEVSSKFISQLQSNDWLKEKVAEFTEAVKQKKEKEFLDNNQDFFLTMMTLAESEEIKLVEGDKK